MKKTGKTVLTIVLLVLLALTFAVAPSAETRIINNEEIKKYDPFYPEHINKYGYDLVVPTLKNRLTVSTDGNTATLFAPYTTKNEGWNDANKNWVKDSALCWAASSSNLIKWYLDVCEKTGIEDVSGVDRDLYKIFDNFKNNWFDEGSDPGQGLSWYFNGNFASGTAPQNLENKNSGGYLSGLKNVGTDAFYQVNLGGSDPEMVFGNYEKKFPFYEDLQGHIGQELPLSTHESFSRNIIRLLHYGASVIMVSKEGVSSFYSHAVTLWGCDYDVKTGLIKNLYIADNDDGQTKLHTVPVTKRPGDRDGVKIKLNPEGPGDATPFTKVTSLTLLYAPGVVNGKVEEEHIHTAQKISTPKTCEENGIKDYYFCESCGKYFEDGECTKEIVDIEKWKFENKTLATGHNFGAPIYTWNGTACTVKRVCRNDDRHIESETVEAILSVTPPTCRENGEKKYTANFTLPFADKAERTEIIPQLEHNFVEKNDGKYTYLECEFCHEIRNKEEIVPPESGSEVPPESDGEVPPESGGEVPPESDGEVPPESGGEVPPIPEKENTDLDNDTNKFDKVAVTTVTLIVVLATIAITVFVIKKHKK